MINIIFVFDVFSSGACFFDMCGVFFGCAKNLESTSVQRRVSIERFPVSAPAHPRVVEVPLAVDDGARGGPRALGHGDGGAEVLVGGLVGAADEAVGVEDLADEVEGLEGDGLAAVVDLLREEGAEGAAAVDARGDLLPEVAHELLLRQRVAARGHGARVLNTAARAPAVLAGFELCGRGGTCRKYGLLQRVAR